MQLINCKISYILGENIINSTELKCSDYTLEVNFDENHLKSNIQTNKSLKDFKIEFYLKIEKKFCKMITNGYQTWSPSLELTENVKTNKFMQIIAQNLTKGTGIDYTHEYNKLYDKNNSYGICYFKEKHTNNVLIFASKDESNTFTKYNFDFDRNILKITRDFKGYTINKNIEITDIISIEKEYKQAFEILKTELAIEKDKFDSEKMIGYTTFSEYGGKINQQIINNKIYTLQKNCNLFIVGDGYSEGGYDLFSLDEKRFPLGFKGIVENIHSKGILAGIWIAPFAISPLSKSFSSLQDSLLKQNEKPVVSCPYWSGAFSLDITKSQSQEYLQNLFNLICNEWKFDVIFCDCTYMAGCIPTDGKTQAMLINEGIKLIRKYTEGKKLILSGVPFLSAINNCDYISIASDTSSNWINVPSILSPELPTSIKNNLQNIVHKKFMNDIYPCIYSVPNSSKIKSKLLYLITNFTHGVIVPPTYTDRANLNVTIK